MCDFAVTGIIYLWTERKIKTYVTKQSCQAEEKNGVRL